MNMLELSENDDVEASENDLPSSNAGFGSEIVKNDKRMLHWMLKLQPEASLNKPNVNGEN